MAYSLSLSRFRINMCCITDNTIDLKSITYNDDLTLTVSAKDARGKISQTAVLYFRNVY